MIKNNVLVIGDCHLPFELPNYLDFCASVRDKYKCNIIVHIGDLVDNHAISYHEHDPNGMSPDQEMKVADKKLEKWFKEFPKVYLCRGNHDSLVDRKGRTSGLPDRAFRNYREIWNLPDSWVDDWEFEFDNVRYTHGSGFSGLYGHATAAIANRQSTVMGHLHSVAGVEWTANPRDCMFGMAVGCGVDRRSYAFNYGKDFKRKPVISCGVVLENGKYPLIVPANLGSKIKML